MKTFLVLLFYSAFVFSNAQTKKSLSHDDYDHWERIAANSLSENGQISVVQIEPQEGDGILEVRDLVSKKHKTFSRGENATITKDERYVIFEVKPTFAEEKKAKIKKTKKDEMPKSHLVIYDIRLDKLDTIKNINSWSMPEEGENAIAVKRAMKKSKSEKEKKNTKEAKGSKDELIVRTLDGSKSDTIQRIGTFVWAREAMVLLAFQERGDSTQEPHLYRWKPNQKRTILAKGMESVAQVALSYNGNLSAWVETNDSAEAKIKHFSLVFRDGGSTRRIDKNSKGLPEKWVVADNQSLSFAKDGSLLFGIKPFKAPYERDTTIPEEEIVKLDIWSWQDDIIQPEQNIEVKKEKDRAYIAHLYDLKAPIRIITDERWREYRWDKRFPTDHVLLKSEQPFLKERSWMYPYTYDYSVYSIPKNKRIAELNEVHGEVELSPGGKYLYWYDFLKKHWMAYSLSSGQYIELTSGMKFAVFNEENDIPAAPDAYGSAGWTENDSSFVFYDAFDIWSVAPSNVKSPVALTSGKGRDNKIRYRYVLVDPNRNTLEPEKWVVSIFHELDKQSGYASLNWRKRKVEHAISGPFEFTDFKQRGSTITFRKGNFEAYPNLYTVNQDWLKETKLTHANAFQKNYQWGKVQLVHWDAPNNRALEGLMYLPEHYAEESKIPLIVYYYETYSDELHRYVSPSPSASIVNFSYLTSNGYAVFVPDITYREGEPGKSAQECIESGVSAVLKQFKGIDSTKMGLQGQSWGGYQTAWMITQSNRYACAMAGAPVSNMTSAYGGIRWGSGMSREFQYERTQSRLGGTLWEHFDRYYNNSPLFFVPQVQTPVLIMHNDEDGAVPWYQGIEFFMALRRLNKPAWMLVYNGEDHNLKKRHNRKDLSIRMMQFFDHYLKGAPAPEWMIKGRRAIDKLENDALHLTKTNEVK